LTGTWLSSGTATLVHCVTAVINNGKIAAATKSI
jgi:hypothetical protein